MQRVIVMVLVLVATVCAGCECNHPQTQSLVFEPIINVNVQVGPQQTPVVCGQAYTADRNNYGDCSGCSNDAYETARRAEVMGKISELRRQNAEAKGRMYR